MNRCYIFQHPVETYIVACIAKTKRHALQMIPSLSCADWYDGDYIKAKENCHWERSIKSVQVENIPLGEVDENVGLRLGIYYFLEDGLQTHPCEKCGCKIGDCRYEDGKIVCYDCVL